MNKKETMEYFWLSNIPEEDIADFGNKYSHEYFWSAIEMGSNGDIRMKIMCEDKWGNPEDFNLTAYGNIDYLEILLLDNVSDFFKDWVRIVKKANEGKTFNGMTYVEAFKKHRGLKQEDEAKWGLN